MKRVVVLASHFGQSSALTGERSGGLAVRGMMDHLKMVYCIAAGASSVAFGFGG